MEDYQREKEIGGYRYRVTQLPSKRGMRLLTQLVKFLGPGLRSFSEGGPAIVADIADRISEDRFEDWCKTLAEFTVIVEESSGKTPALWPLFDLHFRGRYDHLLEWFWFSLEVNYESFLAEVKAMLTQGVDSATLVEKPPSS